MIQSSVTRVLATCFWAIGSLLVLCNQAVHCRAEGETAAKHNATTQDDSASRPTVAIMVGEPEYNTQESLAEFSNCHLEDQFKVIMILEDPELENSFPGVAELSRADILLVSVRRKTLPPEQLEMIRSFVGDGKPVIGIRTANHAFCLRKTGPPSGAAAWPEFDAEVFGGNYTNHYKKGLQSTIHATKENASHPILNGLADASFEEGGTLYQVSPLAEGTTTLMTGVMSQGTPVAGESEPVAWTFTRADGGKSFYTSLGHTADFESPLFQKLLLQAIQWAVQDE